jgi:1-acyl-sn-glycerol-3-phosphate acyltransferase
MTFNDIAFKIMSIYSTIWMRAKARVVVKGLDEVPPRGRGEKRVYVLLNHSTTYDIVALMHVSKEPFVILMDGGAFTFPIIRHFLHGAGFVPLEKDNSKPAFEACVDAVEAGKPLLISLHGGDSTQGDWGKPRTGGLRIARRTGAKIYPIFLKVEDDRIRYLKFKGVNGTEYPYTTFKNTFFFIEFLKPVDISHLPVDAPYEAFFEVAQELDADLERVEARYEAFLSENRERFAPLRRRGGTRFRVAW